MGKDNRTTIMVRNLPIKYTEELLLSEFEEFAGKFDCLYMPYDYERNGNRGFAFVNFKNPLHILIFSERFQGKPWKFGKSMESRKICDLNMANYQGINEIKKHARNYKGYRKPIFFEVSDIMTEIELPIVNESFTLEILPEV
jgi:RNA recognition motif-containing protein